MSKQYNINLTGYLQALLKFVHWIQSSFLRCNIEIKTLEDNKSSS